MNREVLDRANDTITSMPEPASNYLEALPLAKSAKALTELSPLATVQTATASITVPTASTPAAAGAASVPAPAKAESGAAKESATKGNANAGFIKVGTMKLYSLVDLLGEIVIAQSLVATGKNMSTPRSQALSRNMARLWRITNDLQRTAIPMRMVPIRANFQKLIRPDSGYRGKNRQAGRTHS